MRDASTGRCEDRRLHTELEKKPPARPELYLVAVKMDRTTIRPTPWPAPGVTAALTSIVPVLIIAPSALLMKERIAPREILGSAVAVAGAAILAL